MDICGPFPKPSWNGQQFFISFIDDYSRFGNGGTSQGGRGCAEVSEKRDIYRPGRIVIDYK